MKTDVLAGARGARARTLARRATVAFGALALGACASLQRPTPAEPAPVPEAWTAPAPRPSGTAIAAAPTPLARWWERFGDPQLDTLVTRALAAATDMRVAQARLRQARAARDVAAAALGPHADASASAQWSDSQRAPPTRQFRAGFDAGWEIDLWGGNRAGMAAAAADVDAARATLGQAQVALAAEAAAAYVDLRSTQARRASTAASLANQEHTLRIVEWRQQAGLVTQLDVEQQRTAVAQTRAQLPALQTSIEQSMNALAVLTGQAPGTMHAALALPADAAPALPAAPPELALAIPAEVLRQRADVQAAEARVRAAAARIEQADAGRLPSLQLSGSIGLNALSLSGLGSGARVASLLGSVSLPLLDGGRLAAQVRAQEAALDEARANHRATVLAALQEVEDALVALRGAREQLDSQRTAIDAARHAAQLAEQRYASGLADFQSVLTTQRTRLAAEDAVTTTAAALATQHVRLFKALGGGWSPASEPEPATAPGGRGDTR